MMLDLDEGVAELFLDAQAIVIDRIRRAYGAGRAKSVQRDHDYYRFVRTTPVVRAKENAAARNRRQSTRLERASARPPCPHCGAEVVRGAVVPRGRKLPTFCSRRCMRAAIWARYYAKRGNRSEAA